MILINNSLFLGVIVSISTVSSTHPGARETLWYINTSFHFLRILSKLYHCFFRYLFTGADLLRGYIIGESFISSLTLFSASIS